MNNDPTTNADNVINGVNTSLGLNDTINSTDVPDELLPFNEAQFYHDWKLRFKQLGLIGAISLPNTTFQEWLYWFHEWATTFTKDYKAFNQLTYDTLQALNQRMTIQDTNIDQMLTSNQAIVEQDKLLQQRLSDYLDQFVDLKNQVNTFQTSLNDVWRAINALSGQYTWLQYGTDFKVVFRNNWQPKTNWQPPRVGVTMTTNNAMIWVQNNGAAGQISNANALNVNFSHGGSTSNEKVQLLGIQFIGKYAFLNSKHSVISNPIQSAILNVSPQTARATWAASMLFDPYNSANPAPFIVYLLSYADGYNGSFDIYNTANMSIPSANFLATITLKNNPGDPVINGDENALHAPSNLSGVLNGTDLTLSWQY